MLLVLTILSGLAVLALLVVLLIALRQIHNGLERVHLSVQKIAWGVRAIEQETAILKAEAPTTLAGLTAIADGGETLAAGLSSVDARLAVLA
jgi:hypothetical protein